MVLESLVNPYKAERKPFEMFFIGLLYASVAMFLSLWIFKEQASLVMVFLTVIASLPLIYNTLKFEEKKDIKFAKERILLKEHGKALSYFMFLFLGFVVSFSVWYVFLPGTMVETVFNTQISTIKAINSRIIALTVHSSSVDVSSVFHQILINNLKVFLFCVFFSFFYGAGAIFILTWNASVISTAIGAFVREGIGKYVESTGLFKVLGYSFVFSKGLSKYAIHGIPEIASYFIGALAGGIISVAVIRHDFASKEFKRVLLDSLDLILLALFMVFLSAFLEVFVTPAFFR